MKVDISKQVMDKYLEKMLALTPEEEAEIEKQTNDAFNDPVQYEAMKKKVQALLAQQEDEVNAEIAARNEKVVRGDFGQWQEFGQIKLAAAQGDGKANPLNQKRYCEDYTVKFSEDYYEKGLYHIEIEINEDKQASFESYIEAFHGMGGQTQTLQVCMLDTRLFDVEITIAPNMRVATGQGRLLITEEELRGLALKEDAAFSFRILEQ